MCSILITSYISIGYHYAAQAIKKYRNIRACEKHNKLNTIKQNLYKNTLGYLNVNNNVSINFKNMLFKLNIIN